jgi:hypothetical protein
MVDKIQSIGNSDGLEASLMARRELFRIFDGAGRNSYFLKINLDETLILLSLWADKRNSSETHDFAQ